MPQGFCRTAERCKENSRGLSEPASDTPGQGNLEFPATRRVARIYRIPFPGGGALRAYPRLFSLHRSAVRQKPCGIAPEACEENSQGLSE